VICELPEAGLAATGWIEVEAADGVTEQVPLDRGRHRPWRDDVMIELAVEAGAPGGVDGVVKRASTAIRELVETDAIDWRVVTFPPNEVILWVYPRGDALAAFEDLVGSVGSVWVDDRDESLFISSSWEPAGDGSSFLMPGIRSAEVTYRRWTSPARRSRLDAGGREETARAT
jgi:hypothetical protein